MKLSIAIGKSRTDKRWKNHQLTWEEFLERVRKTHRTAETIDEYFAFKKDRQDEIKDVGGFVGGYLNGGRRIATAVTTRQILTLDADEAKIDFWSRFILQYNCAAAIYSTHKHTEDAPRYRLLIPLSREVFTDEYIAICRRIAGDVGIDQFDHTGYQPHRLMYWPSTSKDGVFEFKEQKGPFLDPDEVLGSYINWRDVSEWPMGKREKKVLSVESKKQGDPLEKPGLIGAFNREYGIREAIEKFLPEVYEECGDRFSYKEGSTSGGVVVYDNIFAYSHHSTDPAGQTLCNSFDLVRIHKFGLMDEDPEVPINKRPSYLAMCDLVSSDPKIKKQLGEKKLELAKVAFEEVEVEEVEDLEWLEKMDVDRKGNYLPTINNVAIILEKDPIFKNNIAFDEFEQQAIFRRDTPWRKIGRRNLLNDNDLANIENYIEKVYKFSPANKLKKGLLVVLEKYSFHPVREYLGGLKWDGTKRVDTLLIDYLGAADNEYNRTVTRKALVACVARVMDPGVKFDNVLTFVGEEGQYKSMLLDKLGGAWFSDTFNLHMLQSKEGYEQIQGVWIVEIGELSGMAKAEVERVKGFIAARKDRYRSPYGMTTELRPRQCVFFATTNVRQFLRSQTGNRRFWPVTTYERNPAKHIPEMTPEEIGQIWAEAVTMYRKGETLYLSRDLILKAKEIQEVFTEENPWVEIFSNYLSIPVPENWYNLSRYDKIEFISNYDPEEDNGDLEPRTKVCKYELWEVALGKRDTIDTTGLKMVNQAMEKVKGWIKEEEYVRFGTSYPRHRGSYRREFTLEQLV